MMATLRLVALFAILCAVCVHGKRKAGVENLVPIKELPKYGPWIVQFDKTVQHADMIQHLHTTHASRRLDATREVTKMEVTHEFRKALHAVVISGLTMEELYAIPSVDAVQPNNVKHKTADSWGIRRLQDPDGLVSTYSPDYNGAGSDVYVVDTGLDCGHNEMADDGCPGGGRTCINLYNHFGGVSTNTDVDGHGSHCAGTVGGVTIGVSKCANIFGVKVLGDDGSGSDASIIGGIEAVIESHEDRGKSISVISMSLGGGCSFQYCVNDATNDAIHNAYLQGVISSIAAGNDNVNAIQFSPASTPSAITVGSMAQGDDISSFSNWGEVVDIYAPGSSINSIDQGTTNGYVVFSGTSMACPHVSGVLAQLLQKYPSASMDDIETYLKCDAAQMKLALTDFDTLSPNLLLQVPQNDAAGLCNLGDGCTDDCNGNGVCHPAFATSSEGSTDNICHCHNGYYYPSTFCDRVEGGNNIDSPRPGDCSADSDEYMSVDVRISGSGFQNQQFAIRDPTSGVVVGNALMSMACLYGIFCSAYTRPVCLPEGYYEVGKTGGNGRFVLCGETSRSGYIHVSKTDGGDWSCDYVDSIVTDPTFAPTFTPTAPTAAPTLAPTEPTASPTEAPTNAPTPSRAPTEPPTEIVCAPYSATSTNNANRRTENCEFYACGGDQLDISTCGDCSADTYLRLYKDNTQLGSNDDSCGVCSAFSATLPGTECGTYEVRQGCFRNTACSGTTIISGATPEVELACDAYSLSNTNSAQTNYASCLFTACGGSVVTAQSEEDCVGDQYIRAAFNGNVVARNDNGGTGQCSMLSGTIPGPASRCAEYELRMGCKDDTACSGKFYLSGAESIVSDASLKHDGATKYRELEAKLIDAEIDPKDMIWEQHSED